MKRKQPILRGGSTLHCFLAEGAWYVPSEEDNDWGGVPLRKLHSLPPLMGRDSFDALLLFH